MTGNDCGWARHAAVLGVKIPRICIAWGATGDCQAVAGRGEAVISSVQSIKGGSGRKREKKRQTSYCSVSPVSNSFPFIMLLWNRTFISSSKALWCDSTDQHFKVIYQYKTRKILHTWKFLIEHQIVTATYDFKGKDFNLSKRYINS